MALLLEGPMLSSEAELFTWGAMPYLAPRHQLMACVLDLHLKSLRLALASHAEGIWTPGTSRSARTAKSFAGSIGWLEEGEGRAGRGEEVTCDLSGCADDHGLVGGGAKQAAVAGAAALLGVVAGVLRPWCRGAADEVPLQ